MATLAIWCPLDGVLGTVAPLALAAAAGSALVVDLDPDGPRYPSDGSLAELVENGPRLSDLRPATSGVAVLRNGGVAVEDAVEVLAALMAGWPNVVFRSTACGSLRGTPTVPVLPLLPGGVTNRWDGVAVYQQMGWHEPAPGPALTLPTPSRATVTSLLEGRLPFRSRWVKGWRRVWDLPWA
jgi:hypothetical protein